LHSKRAPDSVALKVKLAEVELVLAAGPLVIEVFGGVVSAGAASAIAANEAIRKIAVPQVNSAVIERAAR
jgi:hypothetical protein